MSTGYFGLFKSDAPGFGPPNYFSNPMDPKLQAMRDRLNKMQAPNSVSFSKSTHTPETFTPDTKAYQAKDYSGALPEYDAIRSQTQRTLNAQGQGAQDAIQRRFARMGNLNSGAYVKAAQLQDQTTAQTTADALNRIGFEESQARRGLQQAEDAKVFQSTEALAGRNFQGQQATLGRNFEALQAAAARNAQAELQTNLFNAQQANQFNQWQFEADTKLDAMDLAIKQQQQAAAEAAFNAAMATYQAEHSGGLLGAGGVLGLGLF